MIKLKELLNEAKREIGGYYLMKQVKDWIADAKSDRETKLVNALQYLYKELEKNRDIELNIDDINYFLNTSNGKKHKKNISTKMINSLFEGKLNEARLNDIVPDIIFTAAQYTSKKLDHIAKQSWDSSDELMKQIMQNIPMSKWKPFRRDVDKLLKQHSIREELMKLTKSKLKEIIREEIRLMEWKEDPNRGLGSSYSMFKKYGKKLPKSKVMRVVNKLLKSSAKLKNLTPEEVEEYVRLRNAGEGGDIQLHNTLTLLNLRSYFWGLSKSRK